jgi:hypothetical protein
MKLGKISAGLTLCVAAACVAQPLLAAPPASPKPAIGDVELIQGGVLIGQVVDTAGVPKVAQPVAVLSGEQQLAVCRTDARGFFAFRGLRGGIYQISVAEGRGAYRAWAPGTAPPTAEHGVLLVTGQNLVRGNYFDEAVGWAGFCICQKPLLMAAVVTTAVVVPVAIHNGTRTTKPFSPCGAEY